MYSKLEFDWLAVILVYYVLLTWCIFLYKSTFNKCIELTDTLYSVQVSLWVVNIDDAQWSVGDN